MTKSEENVTATARVMDHAEAVVITGKMIEAAAKVLEAHGVAQDQAKELAGKAIGAALLARGNS